MTSQIRWLALLVSACAAWNSSILAADTSTLEKALGFIPRQKDVEYETPKPSEYAKCKVEVERKGKLNGWVVIGPGGQVLRKIFDTDGDGNLDQWRYYNQGIEVYRDMDTNHNNKVDQSRWLNLGGTRWGIDSNEDGRIDQWKVLSAAEATREAIRAMTTGDDAALQAVMITADDLKTLGFNPQLATRLLESASDATKKSRAVISKSKVLNSQSRWVRFDAQMPNTIPADDEKSAADLQVYETAMAIIENQKEKFAAVQIGEMIRVGEVWKLTQVPQPIEGESITTSGGILMEPLIASTTASGAPAPSPKAEALLKDLEETERRLMQPGQTPDQVKKLMTKRTQLLKEAIELAETEDEKNLIMKATVDFYQLATQMGNYPDGVDDLKAIESDIAKKSPKSLLLPYTVYRRIQAEFSVNSQKANAAPAKMAAVLKDYLSELEDFVSKYPTADDTDEAMFTLGTHEELQGRAKEAGEWYQRIVKERPKSGALTRAQGALRRLNLNDQTLILSGPSLTDGTVDLKSMTNKVVLVVFWASGYKACEDDLPQLRALYHDYKAKGFEIVGVCLDFDKPAAQTFTQKNKMTWPQIFQTTGPNQSGGLNSPIAESFGIFALPTMFLVNKNGKVVSRNATLDEVKSSLADLLK